MQSKKRIGQPSTEAGLAFAFLLKICVFCDMKVDSRNNSSLSQFAKVLPQPPLTHVAVHWNGDAAKPAFEGHFGTLQELHRAVQVHQEFHSVKFSFSLYTVAQQLPVVGNLAAYEGGRSLIQVAPCDDRHYNEDGDYGISIAKNGLPCQRSDGTSKKFLFPMDCDLHVFVVPNDLTWQWPMLGKSVPMMIPNSAGGNRPYDVVLTSIAADPPMFFIDGLLTSKQISEFKRYARNKNHPRMLVNAADGNPHTAWDISNSFQTGLRQKLRRALRLNANSHFESIQIARYQKGQAYDLHYDRFDWRDEYQQNWDPSRGGLNRLISVYISLDDVAAESGGHTIFPFASKQVWQDNENEELIIDFPPSIKNMFANGTWHDKMFDRCYGAATRAADAKPLRIRPKAGRALVVYGSSAKTGELYDNSAIHGSCPILDDSVKWMLKLYIWNAEPPSTGHRSAGRLEKYEVLRNVTSGENTE